MKILTHAKNFLEFRLRAFVYGLFAVNGFILGVIVHDGLSREAISQYEQDVKAAILERGE